MAIDTCYVIPTLTRSRVRMVGGIEIEDFDLVRQIQPAITPLVPVIRLIEAIIALYEALKSIPSLSPISIRDAIKEAAKKLAAIFGLIPQISIPYMLIDTLDLLIAVFQDVQLRLVRLENELASIDASRAVADDLGNPADLLAIIDCADGNVTIELDNEMTTLQALGSLLAIIDLFASILGVSASVPSLDGLTGKSISEAIAEIDNIIDALRFVRDAIPIP